MRLLLRSAWSAPGQRSTTALRDAECGNNSGRGFAYGCSQSLRLSTSAPRSTTRSKTDGRTTIAGDYYFECTNARMTRGASSAFCNCLVPAASLDEPLRGSLLPAPPPKHIQAVLYNIRALRQCRVFSFFVSFFLAVRHADCMHPCGLYPHMSQSARYLRCE